MKSKKMITGIIVIAVLVVVALIVNILLASYKNSIAAELGGSSLKMNEAVYSADYCYEEGYNVSVQVGGEGSVLLKNSNNTLPLKEKQKVTLFGTRSVNYILGGTGSGGGMDDENTVMMNDAFEEAGLDINQTAWDWLYQALGGKRNGTPTLDASDIETIGGAAGFSSSGWTDYKQIIELTRGAYPKYQSNFLATGYTDYAIVVIGRTGSEGASPSVDYDGDGSTLTGTTYLEIHDNERAMLEFCAEKFTNTIVLINSAAAMELGFINDPAYNIGACLWIGHPGEAAITGVGTILTGRINPSGALVDTYGYDMTTNPTYYNNDNNIYTTGQTFYQYEEGIYMGYRYYETADALGYFNSDAFKNDGPAVGGTGSDGKKKYKNDERSAYEGGNRDSVGGYDNVVQFPFGYGLSYSTFTQQIVSSDIKLETHGTNTVKVKVTNTGNVAGKEIVQLYMDAPFNQDSSLGISGRGLEKAKVVLIGFGKTDMLAANGGTDEVTITFNTDDLASYDNYGKGCYVLEKGNYSFNIQDNAHCWNQTASAQNAVYGSVSVTLANTVVFDETGAGKRDSDEIIAKNVMDDVTAGDGCMLDGYLSRTSLSGFTAGLARIMTHASNETANETPDAGVTAALAVTSQGTYDYTFTTYINGTATQITKKFYAYAADQMSYQTTAPDGTSVNDAKWKVEFDKVYYAEVDENDVVISNDEGTFETYTTMPATDGTCRKLQAKDLKDVPYGHEIWDQVISMASFDECVTVQGDCGWYVPAVESIDKAFQYCKDGPSEPGNGRNKGGTWIPCAVMIASTFNVELGDAIGVSYGNQCVLFGIGGAYAPAMNTHRSPFGGRNFEYYSEDGFIAGKIGGSVVQGIQSTGTNVFIKHFALNDNDTNRGGVCTWVNEQAVREIYNRPYEIAVKEFGANGIMAALNRIGMTWAHYGFHTTMLRDEWGFKGFIITDGETNNVGKSNSDAFLYGAQGAMLGNACLVTSSNTTTAFGSGYKYTLYGQYLLQQVMRHCVYQYVYSGQTEANLSWTWVIAWVIADVVIFIAIVCVALFTIILPIIRDKKTKSA